VTSIAFSTDGEMVATGGMDGKIRIWRRVGTADWKKWEFLTELQGPDEVMVGDLIYGLRQSL
jgi:ribosome assembly protein SQT1